MSPKKSNTEKLNTAVNVCELTVNYDSTPVLWDITFKIPKGVIAGILGPNGSGKTTLLKAILGIVKPLSGKVLLLGSPLDEVRTKIAYVPQKESVDWNFPITVKELVLMGKYGRLGLFQRPSKQDVEEAEEQLEKVGMLQFASRQISQLSGGQQQRAFIARALMQEADLYLMDEPFSGVDMATEAVIIDLLQSLKNSFKTVLIVHHDLMTVESYFDWALLLNLRLIASGPTSEVFCKENLELAFGKHPSIFDEAIKVFANNSKAKHFELEE